MTDFCPGCYRKDAVMDGSEGSLPGTSVALIPTNSPEWKAVLARQEAEYEAERQARLAEQEG